MRYTKFLTMTMAMLLVGGMALAESPIADPPYVFTSDPSDGSIAVIDLVDGEAVEIYPGGGEIEDLVYGPDGYLYACDPENQEIIRLFVNWGDGIYLDDPEYVFTYYGEGDGGNNGEALGSGEDLSPQCGWFTSKGDFIFTDTEGSGLWMCKDLAFGAVTGGTYSDPLCQVAEVPVEESSAGELLPVPDAGFDFFGEGVTQLAGGDALAVQIIPYEGEIYGEGAILQFAMNKPTGTFVDQPPQTLLDEFGDPLDLENPIGIARLSTGDIFVTNFFDGWSGIKRFTPVRDPETGEKYYLNTCNIALDSEGGHGQPFFLEASADDTIYVGSNYDGFAELWTITVDDDDEPPCDPQRVFPTAGTQWQPDVIFGVALTPTWTPPSSITEDEPGDIFINFNDHVYELTLPLECELNEASVLAEEIPLSCIQNLIENHVDDPDYPVEFEALPVTYLGEEAFGIVYNLDGACGETGDNIIHAISAYTETVNNPRILRCTDPGGPALEGGIGWEVCDPTSTYACEVLELDSFFPGDGVLPDDGRIGSRGRASFSQYFVVQSGPSGYEPTTNPATPGESCGFMFPYRGLDSPLPPEVECSGCDRPPIFGPFAWAAFRAIEDGGHCWWGPFIDDTNFLASVTRVIEFDEFGDPVEVFVPMELDTIISGDQPNWFKPPWRWWKPYFIKFWTYDWPEGIYLITAMDLEGGVPVFQDYFEVRHLCDYGEKGCD